MRPLSNSSKSLRSFSLLRVALLCALLALAGLKILARPAQSPDHEDAMDGEVVANLAAGRVIIAVVKDGMVIASLENKIEPGTRPPQIVPLSRTRAAVMLGPVEWTTPSPGPVLARLSVQLPVLRVERGSAPAPSLMPGGNEEVMSQVQRTGLAFLAQVRTITDHLHAKLDLGPEDPFVELILASYDADNGPEAWLLEYTITQDPERGDYWQTQVKRPSYRRLWPPEKGEPAALVEVSYPSDDPSPTLETMLRQNDPRLAGIRSSDAALAAVADHFSDGHSLGITLVNATQFVRAALGAIAPPDSGEAIAEINGENGFDWILEPPKEKDQKKRPPGAPTLVKP